MSILVQNSMSSVCAFVRINELQRSVGIIVEGVVRRSTWISLDLIDMFCLPHEKKKNLDTDYFMMFERYSDSL